MGLSTWDGIAGLQPDGQHGTPYRRHSGGPTCSVERSVSGRYTGEARMNGHHGRQTAGPVAVFSSKGYGLGPREEPLFDR